MSRCRCDPNVVAECLCSFVDSTSINFSGSGSTGSPFTGAVILDPDAGNQAEITASGLLVPSNPYTQTYAANTQLDKVGNIVMFNTVSHDDGIKTADGTFTTPSAGVWEFLAQIQVLRDAAYPFTEVYFGLYNATSGSWVSKTGPCPWPAYASTNAFALVHRILHASAGVDYQFRVRAVDGVETFFTGNEIHLGAGNEETWAFVGKRK